MKYLILILTLLFSFNLKAETYVCAYEYGGRLIQDTLYRDGDVFKQDLRLTTREYDVTENEENQWIVLNEISLINFDNEIFRFEIKAIHKETLEFVRIRNLVSPSTPERATLPVTIERGTCTLIP